MSQVINTNILSMAAQNNLNKSQASLSTAIQRLSSGLRINSAKDNAAGQAISNRFTSLINGLTQASRNANDGIAVAQTAEGAINEINENLHAIRRLTVQVKSTASVSDADKKSIQDEISKRLHEIDRLAEQTEFNGVKILSKDQKLAIQVGANDGQVIDIDLFKLDTNALKIKEFNVNDAFDVSKVSAANVAKAKLDVAPASFKDENVTAKEVEQQLYKYNDNYYVKAKGGSEYYKATVSASREVKYNSGTAATGVTPSAVKTAKIDVSLDVSSISKSAKVHTYTDKNSVESYVLKDSVNVLKDSLSGKNLYFEAIIDGNGKVTQGGELSALPVTMDPLKKIDDAIAKIDEARGALGATQNRLGSVINSLSTTVANLSQSRSNILDADFATEVSNMNRANILQQAGTAVLAQANAVPQSILSLLR